MWDDIKDRGLSGDHPREYGENTALEDNPVTHYGSSPRIRGELHGDVRVAMSGGIIPANTGRMVWLHTVRQPPPDHPREYGENTNAGGKDAPPEGSSPRIRGESDAASAARCGNRIIPANTGRIGTVVRTTGGTGDHPREYGENFGVEALGWGLWGSSPRIRGECVRKAWYLDE